MEIRCLLNTTRRPNIQNGVARCDKTLNNYITKSGKKIAEVVCDYGNGLISKSEITNNQIKNILTDGSIVTYTKNNFGEVLVKENTRETIGRPNLWDNLIDFIYAGF